MSDEISKVICFKIKVVFTPSSYNVWASCTIIMLVLIYSIISKEFTFDSMKKTGLKRSVKFFSVDYNATDTSNILNIHRYWMKETWNKIVFWFIKIVLIGLLRVYTIGRFGESLVFNSKGPLKCVSLSNHPCQTRPILVNMMNIIW